MSFILLVVTSAVHTLICTLVLPSDEDDVKSELIPVSANWRSIGIGLQLQMAILDHIHAENIGKPCDCLTSMATESLKRNYKVEKFGEPTWQWLVKAVGDQAGGEDMALARKIARRHKSRGMSSGFETTMEVSSLM